MFSPISEPLTIELRVLHGSQAGAALPLTDEEIVIGSDGQCDVILQGPGIAPRHACLSIDGDEFMLRALDGEIIASVGAAVAPPWQLGTAVYLGDVAITVDHVGADWRSASPPQTAASEGAQIDIAARCSNVLRRRWKTIALLAATLIGAAIAIHAMQSTHLKAAAGQQLSPANVEAIGALIARYDHGVPLQLDTAGKKAVIHGSLPNVNQVSALKRDLSKWRQYLDIDVQAEDVLLAASRHFLAQEHSTLKVAIVNGNARLSGFGEEKEEVKRLAQGLKKTVSGLSGVDAMFVEREQLEAWLLAWRKAVSAGNPALDMLRVESTPAGDLELHGELAFPLIAQLKDTLIHRSLQKNMLLALRIVVASTLANQHPAVQAFSAGSVPYVFLSNGRRVMIGGAVNGFQLIAINAQGPVFVKQGG